MKQKLTRLLDQANISLTDQQKQQLVDFVKLLDKWNKAYNLTSVRNPDEMLVKHIMDSLVLANIYKGNALLMSGRGRAYREFLLQSPTRINSLCC